MNTFIIYLIQSALCLASLYLIYWFFLRKDTFFTANRFYLIGSIILSFILPMFEIPVFYNNTEVVYVVALEAITVTASKIEDFPTLFSPIKVVQVGAIVNSKPCSPTERKFRM